MKDVDAGASGVVMLSVSAQNGVVSTQESHSVFASQITLNGTLATLNKVLDQRGSYKWYRSKPDSGQKWTLQFGSLLLNSATPAGVTVVNPDLPEPNGGA